MERVLRVQTVKFDGTGFNSMSQVERIREERTDQESVEYAGGKRRQTNDEVNDCNERTVDRP